MNNVKNVSEVTNISDLRGLGSTRRTYEVQFGENLGMPTITMRLSIMDFIKLSVVHNQRNISEDARLKDAPLAQRPIDDNHVWGLGRYSLTGLMRATIDQDNIKDKEILELKKKLEGSQSPHQALQPIVCNIRDTDPSGKDLALKAIKIIDELGNENNSQTIFNLTLSEKHLLSVVDGQHRREGFKTLEKYLEYIISNFAYPYDDKELSKIFIPSMINKEELLNAKVVDFYRKIYTRALNNATLTLEVHIGLSADQERQLFADLNSKGRRVPMNIAYDFDRSDAVNVFIKDVLIDNQILNLDLIEKPSDEKNWSDDTGALLRKDINPVTAFAILGKQSTKDSTPEMIEQRALVGQNFWNAVQKVKDFGKPGAKSKTVLAQTVVLKGLAKLLYDMKLGTKPMINEEGYHSLLEKIAKNEIDFSHSNEYWSTLMLDNEARKKDFPELDPYVHVPSGTNLDAGTVDPEFGWVRYGSKHNDILARIGDLIRFQAKLPPRPQVTKAIEKEAGEA